MDAIHHLGPWINSCVGNNNHFAFLSFVCSVPVGCSMAFVINVFYFMEYCPSIRAALWIAKYQPQVCSVCVCSVWSVRSFFFSFFKVVLLYHYYCTLLLYTITVHYYYHYY